VRCLYRGEGGATARGDLYARHDDLDFIKQVSRISAHGHSFRFRVGLARLWELPEKLIERSRCIIIDCDGLYAGIPQGPPQNACRKIGDGDRSLFAHRRSPQFPILSD
jgi:hypothetical protein